MLGLPKSTEFNRRIPKQKFYENLSVTPALKRIFIDQIKVIYWRNKIAATTMNLAAGDTVTMKKREKRLRRFMMTIGNQLTCCLGQIDSQEISPQMKMIVITKAI